LGNGGKSTTKSFATAPPFQNTTIAQSTSTKAGGNGGKGGNNNVKDTTSSAIIEASTTPAASASSPSVAAIQTTTKKGNGGRPAFTAKAGGGKQTTVVVVHKVVVIKTFFKFVFSLGGLPPAVGKKGQSFVVFEDLFDDFPSACAAACGHQFTKCISFSGPGFSFQECTSQKNKCANVASSASVPAAPETVTATVTVPPTASVTGSVISEVTITTTVQASQASQAAPTLGGAEAIATSPAENECAVVTNTIFIDPPAPTAAAISSCDVVTSTVFIDPPSATATPIVAAASSIVSSKLFPNSTIAIASATSSAPVSLQTSAALGGIAAPEITDSGDASRPFAVKGNTFSAKSAAVQRSCDVQFNACANAFNGGTAKGFNLADCKKQQDACVASGA